ncbi:MAG: aminomethyl-transferring glycine dehydrogenase subunit GcvPB [Lentisphaeria bacterium]|nr:aminomethyl-transferring glycine dehydrogenase subunit GcvPB [Lentisphaeria bacterium]
MSVLIFEKSQPGRRGITFSNSSDQYKTRIDKRFLREEPPALPEVSELDVIRHYTSLSQKNFSIDTNFYPLGSCTMKYNPRLNEKVASLEGFANLHPLMAQLQYGGQLTQGALRLIHEIEQYLCEICGMKAFTMQPMAGAHGELTGLLLIRAYHEDKGNQKTKILIPDAAHGTNPASAAIAGYDCITIPTGENGCMDMEAYEAALGPDVAGVMLTCPNTVGLFNPNIDKVTELAHKHDALVYYDGANMNAIMGRARPGDLGFDVIHINLHKTFSTPHGGGGPGGGPVGVSEKLIPYLPISQVEKRKDGTFTLNYDCPKSIGYLSAFYGNFMVNLRAYTFMLRLGGNGMKRASDMAVLNANYVRAKLADKYNLMYPRICMHEVVFDASKQAENGVHALDIAKALLDKGLHAPTMYFPLVIKEALMIEPTESESKQTIDEFIEAMRELADIAETDPDWFKETPRTTRVSRVDEVAAAKNMDLAY